MPKRKDIKKILVVGAGPIIIGQACEFDYSGTQATRALKEAGLRVVLSLISTIIGKEEVVLFKRTVNRDIIRRSLIIFIFSIIIIIFSFMIISSFEPDTIFKW